MTISPLLQNRINSTPVVKKPSEAEEKIYEDLKKRANEVRPNEARAKLVVENPISAAVSYVKDTKKDLGNFTKAVTTGKLSDHPLGRLNDIGLKAGALLIAAFLAKNSKTKTEAIMKFVGGGTFLASMSLWPKIFINLPARLIHGFRIDEKYISAQGDKKDFFLDNQFLPWDAYPKERLMQNAKRAGIDPNEPNSEEKIQRKMQKTALQNRTLWMATAGFATPTMTSLICSQIEPHIQTAVVKHDVKKASKILETPEALRDYLAKAKPEVQNKAELEKLLKVYNDRTLDKEFYTQLMEYLNLNIEMGSADDFKPLRGSFSHDLVDLFEELEAKQPILTDDFHLSDLKQALSKVTVIKPDASGTKSGLSFVVGATNEAVNLTQAEIDSIIAQIKANPTLENATAIFKQFGIQGENQIKSITSVLRFNNSELFKAIKDYNENILSVLRGRTRAYTKLVNTVAGSRAESAYTKIATDSIKSLFKQLHLSDEELQTLAKGATEMFDESVAEFDFDPAREVLMKAFSKFAKEHANLDDESYVKALQKYIGNGFEFDISKELSTLVDKNNIEAITDVERMGENNVFKQLTDAIFGRKGETASLYDRIFKFIRNESINLDATQNKALLCANFERRILDGSFVRDLEDKGLISEFTPAADYIRVARKMVYDGSVALDKCQGELNLAQSAFNTLKSIVYNPNHFNKEAGVRINNVMRAFGGSGESSIKDLVIDLNNLGITKQDYSKASSFFSLAQNTAKQVSNSKAWLKNCGIFAGILVGVTLLAQPFFGNIKKEFQQNSKEGGAK